MSVLSAIWRNERTTPPNINPSIPPNTSTVKFWNRLKKNKINQPTMKPTQINPIISTVIVLIKWHNFSRFIPFWIINLNLCQKLFLEIFRWQDAYRITKSRIIFRLVIFNYTRSSWKIPKNYGILIKQFVQLIFRIVRVECYYVSSSDHISCVPVRLSSGQAPEQCLIPCESWKLRCKSVQCAYDISAFWNGDILHRVRYTDFPIYGGGWRYVPVSSLDIFRGS